MNGPTDTLQATGPEQIRAAFTTAIDATSGHTEDLTGIAGVLGEAADRYEALQMTPSTLTLLRDGAAAVDAAATALGTAEEQLQAALGDFNNRDGHVGDAVTETGNLMQAEGYTETIAVGRPAGHGRHRAADPAAAASTDSPRKADMIPTEPAAARRGHYDPDQPRAADGKWTAAGAEELPDVLDEVDEETCFGSDVVAGQGPVTTELRLMDYTGQEGSSPGHEQQFVAVGPSREPGDVYAEPNLSADEAEQAAKDLEELADQAEAGYIPPKPSKYARAAQRVRQMLAADDDFKPADRVAIGYDDDTLPITYKDLLQLLAQADPHAGGGPRRTVRAKASRDSGGEDGLLIMDLAASRDGTQVTVLAMEGTTSDPDDAFWDKYRAAHTPDQARELAGKLRRFARGARNRAGS